MRVEGRAFSSGAVALVALVLAACNPAPETPRADLILRGGTVLTMDAASSRAEAIAIGDGRILAVGTSDQVSQHAGPATRIVELGGQSVLPGFHDSHVHPLSGGIELGQCNLNSAGDREALFAVIARCAERTSEGVAPADDWIVGGGWALPAFPGANPHKRDLDRIAAGRPVFLTAADGHSTWVSSRALTIASVDRNTRDPPRGRIERDASGEPSGTLREAASELVSKHLPAITGEQRVAGLRRGIELANRFGITSFIEASATEETLRAYSELDKQGALNARVVASLWVDPARGPEQVDDLMRLRAEYTSRRVRPVAAKIFADGVIEAGTAALLEPYLSGPAAGTRGELNFEQANLVAIVTRLEQESFQVHVHAIGDGAIRAALDAFEAARSENGIGEHRGHIAHIELFDPADIPRFRALDVAANFQPLWAYADTYITDLTEPVLGPARSRWLYPIRSVLDSGARVVGGSDWSVSSLNPLEAIQVAVTRQGLESQDGEPWIPAERADLDSMLAAYTRNGAWLMKHESETGTLEVGKAADLVVLDRDLSAVEPHAIGKVEVVSTWLAGQEVYRRPDR